MTNPSSRLMEQKRHYRIFWKFSNQYISKILNLYNPKVNLILSYQTKCDNMFSDPGVVSYIFTFFTFQLCTWFIFCFFSCVVIIHLIQRREGVGIYCKLIPGWIKQIWAQLNWIDLIINIIYRPIQSWIQEPNSKYYLENYFITEYTTTLTLFRFFDCDRIPSI